MRLERWDEAKDGRPSEPALRRKLEALGYAVSRYVYPPGTDFPVHTHEVDKVDAVVSGRFRIGMQGRSVELGPGDYVFVPRGTPHSAEVVGSDPVVSLDGVSAR